MLHFFRKIRHDLIANSKTYKYFKYAVGEVVLVVLGILIALQINNWNEEKKTEQRIVSFLIEIQNNLDNDILKANTIIDNYIVSDSILRNIRQSKVIYKDFTQDRGYINFTYNYENFAIQTKGFDGLVKNIDNIPEKYSDIMEDLNEVFITNKILLDTYDERLSNIVNTNLDGLKNKDWVVDYWNWETNKTMIDYFQSESYKIEAMYYFEAKMKLISKIVKFKIDAIDVYKKIEKVIGGKKEIPEHISYSISNAKVLNLFAGTYIQYKLESPQSSLEEEISFSVKDNQLSWNYSYQDKNRNEKFDILLPWHKDSTFLFYDHHGIWKFEIVESGDVFFTHSQFGLSDLYIKRTKE
jgi:hypothetical protein